MTEPSIPKNEGGGWFRQGCLVGVLAVVAVIVGVAVLTNDSSPTTMSVPTTTAAPITAVAADRIVLASWESDWGDLTVTESLVYSRGAMSVVAVSSDGSETVLFEVEERPADNPGERRFDLQPWDPRSEYLVLSADGTVRYFSWEGRQFEYARVTYLSPDAMTIGLDVVDRPCVPKVLSSASLEIIRLYEQMQGFKDDPEFEQMGFAIGGPYNEWLTTVEDLEADFGESMNQLGFLAGDVMMLGMEYVFENREGIAYFENLIEAGIALAYCDEKQDSDRVAASAATTTTLAPPPPNPGNAVNCADFDTWEEAQAWYDTYAPHYGDVALIDTNNNGVACEKLLPEGLTVEEAAAALTTSTAAPPELDLGGVETIKLAVNPWDGSAANVAVAAAVLEGEGYTVERVEIDENGQWGAIATGDLHASLEVWPSGHADNVASYIDGGGGVVNGGELGAIGKIGWWIPTYVVEQNPAAGSWEGLQDPATAQLYSTAETGDKGQFLIGDPSWVSFEQDIIDNLGLHLEVVYAGSEEALLAAMDSATSRGDPLLFYWWTPHSAFSKFDLSPFELPAYSDECYASGAVDCDYPDDVLFKIMWDGLEEGAPTAFAILSNFNYTNEDQIFMLGKMDEGLTVDEAAAEWMDANESVWQAWIPR